jgi:hypothetical protein
MAHSQLLFIVLATGLRHVPLSAMLLGKLSRMNCLFVLNYVSSPKHRSGAQMFLLMQYTPVNNMTSLFGLPTELLHNVLVRLEQDSLKEFRRVCRESCARVTPILFNRVYFDFDPGGTDGLVNICRHPLLATHVKTIELRRRSGLKKLDDFGMWQEANIYEYEPFLSHESHDHVEVLEAILSARDWHSTTDDSRRALFDDYQKDYDAMTRRTSQLASAMSSAIQHGQGFIPGLQNVTEAHQEIREFNAAVERLRNITNFHHCPTYHYDEWGERWRQIQFHRDAFILGPGYEDDVDADALQLFVALQGIILHTDTVRKVTLHTRGHAFWSATHLRRLLDWSDDSTTRWITDDHLEVGINGWIDRIGGPLAACRYMESATRYLARLESGFSRLESLACHVDTDGLESSDDEISVSKAVSRVLQCGTNLRKLRLALRQSSWDPDRHTLLYHKTSFSSRLQLPLNSQQDSGSLLVSRNMFRGLVASQALADLQTLDLTIITVERHLCALLSQLRSLRHLALRYVSLLSEGGVWESIFQLISTSLHLESAALVGLEDVVDGYPRLLLQSDAPIWNSGTFTHTHYQRYESAIIDFVLRRSASLPAICPADFFCQLTQ